jgi:hypothetical protein
MKFMIRLVLITACWCVCAGPTNAQPPRGPRDRPNGPPPRPEALEAIVEDLKLSPAARAEAEKILEAHNDRMRKARDEARKVLLTQMKQVLTASQFAQFSEEIDRRGPPPPRRGTTRGVSIDRLVDHVMSFDKDKDGKVTRDELPDRLHYLFEKSGGEKNGSLTRAQVAAIANKVNADVADDRPPPPRR